jgi:hypothetical protein
MATILASIGVHDPSQTGSGLLDELEAKYMLARCLAGETPIK